MDSWIAEMCARAARRQFFAWFLLLSVGILFLLFNVRYARNFVEGPFPVASSDLARIRDADLARNYYVSVGGDKVIDTGIQEITTTTDNGQKTGEYVSARYYAVLVSDRVLIVKGVAAPGSRVLGELKPFPNDLSEQLFSGADGQQLRSDAYPFYLDTGGFRDAGYWAIGVSLVFLALFVRFGGRAWSRWRDVTAHPVLKRVTEQWGDVVGTSVDAERELKSGVVYRGGGIFITGKYVITKQFFAFNIFRFEDMLWAYKKVIRRSVNFIPTGKSYQALLSFYGGSTTFGGSEAKVQKLLAYAAARAPWAIIGYTKELGDIFRKSTTEFCQAVEARRREVLTAKIS